MTNEYWENLMDELQDDIFIDSDEEMILVMRINREIEEYLINKGDDEFWNKLGEIRRKEK